MPSIAALTPNGFKNLHICGDLWANGERLPRCSPDSPCRHARHGSLMRAVIENQSAYAHYMKLLALFVIAAVHVTYMGSFLKSFASLADYTERINAKASPSETYPLRYQMELLSDYKKNMWMTVGSMCVALSTSCFFLLLNTSAQESAYIIVMRFVDLLAFSTLPALLLARSILVHSIHAHLPEILHKMQALYYPNEITTSLHCSMVPKENIPLCSTVILNSLFPMFIIKYLIVLAILTIVYIALAYLIEWCLKHWFPPSCHRSSRHPVYAPVIIAH